VLIPRLTNALLMLKDSSSNSIELVCTEPGIAAQRQRIEPELAGCPITLNMHVDSLHTVEAIEKEPIGAGNIRNRWHANRRTVVAEASKVIVIDLPYIITTS
jgi:hypothetical protein